MLGCCVCIFQESYTFSLPGHISIVILDDWSYLLLLCSSIDLPLIAHLLLWLTVKHGCTVQRLSTTLSNCYIYRKMVISSKKFFLPFQPTLLCMGFWQVYYQNLSKCSECTILMCLWIIKSMNFIQPQLWFNYTKGVIMNVKFT